jgi:predicted DNA-binding protein
MAKKTPGANKMGATSTPARKRSGKAVRLDLSPKDHDRLDKAAEERGLSKSSYARMAVLAYIKQDEEDRGK